ncbi:MAG: hypothetical protein ABL898_03730 [Hyphomicrobiaceae bacterium]|nr:hypothetical protein [Hyphomicrobiaceae bacterium]
MTDSQFDSIFLLQMILGIAIAVVSYILLSGPRERFAVRRQQASIDNSKRLLAEGKTTVMGLAVVAPCDAASHRQTGNALAVAGFAILSILIGVFFSALGPTFVLPEAMAAEYARISKQRENSRAARELSSQFTKCAERNTSGMGEVVTFSHLAVYQNCIDAVGGRAR